MTPFQKQLYLKVVRAEVFGRALSRYWLGLLIRIEKLLKLYRDSTLSNRTLIFNLYQTPSKQKKD